MAHDFIVIGGGLSGLRAAVDLSSRGLSVLLLERRNFLGGRTYSFIDEATGDVVDNGQHLLMGCYKETRSYLRTIGSEHLAHLQPNLHIDFLHPTNGIASLSCPPLPAPFHLLGGMLRLRTLRFVDRLKLIRVGLELQKSPKIIEPKIASMTVDEWMTSLGQPEGNKKYLWDIIAIGSLNDDPKTVSALLFYRVLRAAFTGARENSSMLIPRVGLSELLVDPAVEFIRKHGGEVRPGCAVREIHFSGDRVERITCEDGSTLTALAYISAVPYYALASILPPSLRRSSLARHFFGGTPEPRGSSGAELPQNSGDNALRGSYTPERSGASGEDLPQNHQSTDFPPLHPSTHPFHALSKFDSSPIITINLWLDRPVMEQEFVALLDSRVQWIFNRSKLLRLRQEESRIQNTDSRQYLSLVISGAAGYVEWPKEKLVEAAMADLREALPAARDATVLHSLVVKEKRATFSPKPGVEAFRPRPQTHIKNLFLAGDWTDTGYPATIEGAVMSGRRAADEASRFLT